MLKIKYKIKSEDLNSSKFDEIDEYLNHIFEIYNNNVDGDDFISFSSEEKELLKSRFSILMEKCPNNLDEILFFIKNNSIYANYNLSGKFCLYYLWPFFFEKFSKGEIWILECSSNWLNEVSKGELQVFKHFSDSSKNGRITYSHDFAGISPVEFHFNCLDFLSTCVYPLISSLNISFYN